MRRSQRKKRQAENATRLASGWPLNRVLRQLRWDRPGTHYRIAQSRHLLEAVCPRFLPHFTLLFDQAASEYWVFNVSNATWQTKPDFNAPWEPHLPKARWKPDGVPLILEVLTLDGESIERVPLPPITPDAPPAMPRGIEDRLPERPEGDEPEDLPGV